jgi:hypothetical protein
LLSITLQKELKVTKGKRKEDVAGCISLLKLKM